MRAIRSFHHSLHTISQNKVALSAFDSKRWVCEDGVETLACGHWKTAEENESGDTRVRTRPLSLTG